MTLDNSNNHEIIYYGKKVYNVNFELCKKIESKQLNAMFIEAAKKDTKFTIH